MKTTRGTAALVFFIAILVAGCGVVTLEPPPTQPEARDRMPVVVKTVRPKMPPDTMGLLLMGPVEVLVVASISETGAVTSARVRRAQQYVKGEGYRPWPEAERTLPAERPEMTNEERISLALSRQRAERDKRASDAILAAAVEAVRQWTFKPALLEGRAVSYDLTVPLDFHW